jgi:hypothetical protein
MELLELVGPPLGFAAIIFTIVLGSWYFSNGSVISTTYLTAAFVGGVCLTAIYVMRSDYPRQTMMVIALGMIFWTIVSIIAIQASDHRFSGNDALLSFDIAFAITLGLTSIYWYITYILRPKNGSAFVNWE